MDKKRLCLPLALFLLIFLPTLYFVVRWPGYYSSVQIIAPDTTFQILLGFKILFTVMSTVLLSFWAIYLSFLILRSKENSSLKPFVAILVLACTAISITAIYRGYVALFKEGFQVSWYRIYTHSHHINFISNWFNLFIVPILLITLLLGLLYYLKKTKNHNLAIFTLFGSLVILLFWCFVSNYLHWNLVLQGPMYQLLNSRYSNTEIRYNLLYFYNPFQVVSSFFRSISNFFLVNQVFPTGLDLFSSTLRISPKNTLSIINTDTLLANVKPSLSFIFYARTLIILALTSFMSLIHYELLKTSSEETPRSK